MSFWRNENTFVIIHTYIQSAIHIHTSRQEQKHICKKGKNMYGKVDDIWNVILTHLFQSWKWCTVDYFLFIYQDYALMRHSILINITNIIMYLILRQKSLIYSTKLLVNFLTFECVNTFSLWTSLMTIVQAVSIWIVLH